MARLEELTRGAQVKGILPGAVVTVVDVQWHGAVAIELTYKDAAGHLGSELLYRDRSLSCPSTYLALPSREDRQLQSSRQQPEQYHQQVPRRASGPIPGSFDHQSI